MLNREICSLTTQSEINLYSQKRDVIVARPFHFYRDKTIMDGGEARTCPPAQFSLSAFPITRQSLLISKDTSNEIPSFSLSLWTRNERKENVEEEKKDVEKKRGEEALSVIERKFCRNKRAVLLSPHPLFRPLSLFSY